MVEPLSQIKSRRDATSRSGGQRRRTRIAIHASEPIGARTREKTMHGTKQPLEEARERAFTTPLNELDPGDPELFRNDAFWPYFDRLRQEDPVHRSQSPVFGQYWSITKYNDIMEVET